MKLLERVRPAFAVVLLSAAFAACGGGGGGSVPSGGGGGGVPSGGGGGGGPTPTPTPASTLPPSSSGSVTTSTTQSQTGSFGPISGGYTGTITVPPASVVTTIGATFTTTQPSGPPTLAAIQRRPQNIGASPISADAYLTVTSPATVTFSQAPSFTIVFPFAVTAAMGATSYVAIYDPTKASSGWTTIEGPATATSNTLTFNGTFNGATAPLTLTANITYTFVLFTLQSALPTPTPTPTSTPTPASSGYVAPTGGVTQLGPNATDIFSSSLLSASTDGTFVVQSADAPAEPSGAASPLTEYDVSASESAAGQKPSSAGRLGASFAASRADGSAMRYRARRDFGQASLSRMSRKLSNLTRVARSPQATRRTNALAVNTVRTFHVFQGTITGTGGTCTSPQITIGSYCYLNVPATLQSVSNHGYVWVDNAIDASYGFTAADWQNAGTAFDTDFTRETVAFGPAFFTANAQYQQCDAQGNALAQGQYTAPIDLSGSDPHISFLVTKALENTGEGGYFLSLDLLNDQEQNCVFGGSQHIPTNGLPMFVVGSDKYSGTADENYWRTQDMPRTLPHEFQHMLHAVNKIFIADLGGSCNNPNGCGVADDSFVDEGDSMLAEDLVNPNNAQSNDTLLAAFTYLYNPANYSLTSWVGYDQNPLDTSQNPPFAFYRSTEGNYGGGYLFARYLYDRFGGDTALHRVYADLSSTPTGVANLGPIVAEANNGESFAQLYADFAAALAARKIASTDPRFTFNSTVFLVGSKTVPIPGGTWDIQMNGPRSPDDITNTYPSTLPRIKLTANGTVSAKLITGATLFFNAAASAGSIVSLNSTSAPANKVYGALVQGAYGDNGACLGPAPGC
jgi:hypothetical protein